MLCGRKRERNNVQVRSPVPEKPLSIPTMERERRERSTSPVSRYSPPSVSYSSTPVEVSLEFRHLAQFHAQHGVEKGGEMSDECRRSVCVCVCVCVCALKCLTNLETWLNTPETALFCPSTHTSPARDTALGPSIVSLNTNNSISSFSSSST